MWPRRTKGTRVSLAVETRYADGFACENGQGRRPITEDLCADRSAGGGQNQGHEQGEVDSHAHFSPSFR